MNNATPPLSDLLAALTCIAESQGVVSTPDSAPDSAAGEHALAFELGYLSVLSQCAHVLAPAQKSELDALNAYFGTLGDFQTHPHLWTDAAFSSSPEWEHVRALCRACLAMFA